MKVVRIKDRFAQPKSSGYRDILINVEMSNGHIVEIQLHLKSILRAKKIETKLYEQIRAIEDRFKKEGRKPTVKELEAIEELEKKSREIYNKALLE